MQQRCCRVLFIKSKRKINPTRVAQSLSCVCVYVLISRSISCHVDDFCTAANHFDVKIVLSSKRVCTHENWLIFKLKFLEIHNFSTRRDKKYMTCTEDNSRNDNYKKFITSQAVDTDHMLCMLFELAKSRFFPYPKYDINTGQLIEQFFAILMRSHSLASTRHLVNSSLFFSSESEEQYFTRDFFILLSLIRRKAFFFLKPLICTMKWVAGHQHFVT